MKVLILTEGGKNIGFGHIARGMSLCQAFEEKGVLPKLIINGKEDVRGFLKNRNFQILNWTKKVTLLNDTDIAVVDSYLAGKSIYEKLSDLVKVPVFIDDTNRLDYPKGIVLNGSIYADTLDYTKKNGLEYLLGIKFALLRKEFWEVPKKKINKEISKIMVTFGGTDIKNMTPKILSFLNENYPELQKIVIIGNGFKNKKDFEGMADKNTKLIYGADAKKMKEIMLLADVAIASGGQTLYELIRVGTPVIGICVAENQVAGLEKFKKMKLIEYIGSFKDKTISEKILVAMEHIKSQKIRKGRSDEGRRVIDGKGCRKLVGKLLSYLQK
jgi:spore coat polysaccharide biosynthesis predicted glycosyltransferase SpsG